MIVKSEKPESQQKRFSKLESFPTKYGSVQIQRLPENKNSLRGNARPVSTDSHCFKFVTLMLKMLHFVAPSEHTDIYYYISTKNLTKNPTCNHNIAETQRVSYLTPFESNRVYFQQKKY